MVRTLDRYVVSKLVPPFLIGFRGLFPTSALRCSLAILRSCLSNAERHLCLPTSQRVRWHMQNHMP